MDLNSDLLRGKKHIGNYVRHASRHFSKKFQGRMQGPFTFRFWVQSIIISTIVKQ